MKALLRKIRQILKDRRTRRFLTRVVSGVAAVVVFVTTYALVLPAITMESQVACGIEAHQHDDSCYTENLICGQEESEGHHHTDDCYTVTRKLECQIQEHQHSSENGCFDEEGNLVCKLQEHTHSDSCYKELRELTCGLEESEGHHHTDSCYEKVLTCGKEVHTHSAACYKVNPEVESAGVASTGMTSAAAPDLSDKDYYSENTDDSEDSQDNALVSKSLDEAELTEADKNRDGDKISPEDNSEDETETDSNAEIKDEKADRDDIKAGSDDADKDDEKDTDNSEEGEEAASSFSTGFAADEDAENGDAYIPEKEALDFSTVLNSRTGIYYHHMAEDEEIEDSSAITDWSKADGDTKLDPGDLIRVYLSYTLPKDTINATNDISRYRLPDTLHLTDDQIEAINNCENGISTQYIDYDNLEITDPERHAAYLGLESVEGTRRPGEELNEGNQEFISAVVRADKIYDEDTGEYEGTDLIFTFSPYTVEKNAHAYDKKGQPTSAGEEVTGWLTLDFNMGQIDWAEDNTSEIVFAEEDKINTVLKQADPEDAETDENASDGTTEADAEYATEEAVAATTTAAETAAENSTEAAAADTAATAATASETAAESISEKTDADARKDSENKKESKNEITAANYPAAVFDDSIIVRSGRLDTDLADTDLPKKTKMTVHVEADEGTFPEGTRMVLSPVEDLNAVAEAVGTAVDSKTRGFQAVDITFYDKDPAAEDAKEIEPLKPIRVSIKSDEIKKAAEDSSTAPVVVHIEDDNTATEIENTASETDSGTIEIEKPGVEEVNTAPENKVTDKDEEVDNAASEDSKDPEDEIANQDKETDITAPEDETADQDKETDNAAPEDKTADQDKETDNAAPENDITDKETETDKEVPEQDKNVVQSNQESSSDSSADTVDFEADSFSVYAIVYTVDFHYSVDGKTYDFSIPGGGFVSLQQLVEVLGIANSDSEESTDTKSKSEQDEDSESNTVFTLEDIQISDYTKEFVADVKEAEFSKPELVWIGKADADNTVGGLKEANKLDCEYSAELTEDQIAKINALTVEGGDWALISMQPFLSKETLTITMSDGDQFTVRITDSQISTTVLTADGKTYKITVTFDDKAEIPTGTKLVAEEIKPGSDEYIQYLGRTWAEVNKDYLNQQKQGSLGEDDIVDIRPVNLDQSRFFDVSFVYKGEEIEPKAPVQVNIQLDDGLSNSADAPITGIVHFPKATDPDDEKSGTAEIELIEDFEEVKDKEGSIVEYSYELDCFSVIGAYLGQKTEEVGISPEDPAVTLPKLTALRAGEAIPVLNDLEAEKKLTPNTLDDDEEQTDGTYTLSLSVKGDAAETNQITKANVLIVMDRSTSMRETVTAGIPYTGQLQQGGTYYGFINNKLVTLNYSSASGLTYELENGESGVYDGTVYVNSTRLQSEQAALDELVGALVAKNDPTDPDKDDIIEVCVTSFASARGSVLKGADTAYDNTTQGHPKWSGTTESGWQTSYGEGSTLYSAVHNTSINNGTNWEDALMYAKQTAATMKQAQPDEDVYIIFLTDGEPTAVYGEKSQDFNGWGARHYENASGVTGGGSIYALGYAKHDDRTSTQEEYGEIWDVQDIVNEGYKFFSIFTFNNNVKYSQYLKHLVNYAYGVDSYETDPETTSDTPTSDTFYTNARNIDELRNSFDNIFSSIQDSLSYGDVKIVDGLTTDSMSTNIADGHADGIVYTVKDNNNKLLYTVTATGNSANPKVTFKIGEASYSYDPSSGSNTVRKISSYTTSTTETNGDVITKTDVMTTVTVGGGTTTVATKTTVSTSEDNGETFTIVSRTTGTPVTYPSENEELEIPEGAATYYSLTVGGIEYRMALASTETTTVIVGEGEDGHNEDKRTLTWDLSPIGSLAKDYTYTMECVVWPNQEAYDYLAGLNNKLEGYTWDDSIAEPVYDREEEPHNILYYKGGVKEFPSIVKYEPDGPFSVLSNTEQKVTYADVYSKSTNDIITLEEKTPHEKPLETPDPMPLTDTETYLQKEWSADRNPALLAQYLYKADGTPTKFCAQFDIYQEDDYQTNPEIKPYKTISLGWDEDQNRYVWAEGSPLKRVVYKGRTYYIGTRWAEKFSIPTGVMLSLEQLTADQLNPDDYATAVLEVDGVETTYYILEPGHDYYIEEKEELGYEFDFISPVFHPMLVDGDLMNIVFEEEFENEELDPEDVYHIAEITPAPGGIGTLIVENKLRAYINLKKVVVDKDGRTALPDDDTKFTYRIDLNNDMDPGPFVGEHIPWYGVNDLFYHDEAFNYYQAEVTDSEDDRTSHTLTIMTETGGPYEAVCTDEDGNERNENDEYYIFNEDVTGPSWIKYNDGSGDKIIQLWGNLMDCEMVDIEVETEEGGTETQTVPSANHVFAELKINQTETLSLANIPRGTTYTIAEVPQTGYDLVNIRQEILNGNTVESRNTFTGKNNISDTVVPDRDNNLVFTNKIHSTDITVKKEDTKGKPLTGAVFTVTRTDHPAGLDASEYDNGVSKPAAGEADAGVYKFYGLPDGIYTLTETTPPEGYTGISGTVSFTVTGGVVSVPSNLPTGVSWDNDTAAFTVKNPESSDNKITVRKQWLDADGNPTAYEGTLDLTLKQWVPRDVVTVNFYYYDNYPNSRTLKATRTASGSGRLTVEWRWDDDTNIGTDRISITGAGNNNNYSVSSLGNRRFRLTVNNVSSNATIGVVVNNWSIYDPWKDNGGQIGEITLSNPSSGNGQYEEVASQTVTLGNGSWSKQFTVSGSNPMTDTNLPATYQGKTCYYTIEEPSVPGYVLDTTLSSDLGTPVTSGILAAYNKQTESGSLGVNKIVQASDSQLAGGNMHRANGRYNFTVSRVTSENPLETQLVKYVQIQINDGAATYKVSSSPISYEDNTGFRWVYAEGAIVDNLIPGSYIVEETGYQLTNPDGYTMELAQIEVGGSGPNTVDLPGKKTRLTVTEGELPTATSIFTNMLVPELDVPVVKTWDWSSEDEGNVASWSATFNLEYREVLVSGEAHPDAVSRWTPVYEADGTKPRSITITSPENSDTGTFDNLPMYRSYVDEDGFISVYRIIYAVDEVAYTITPVNGEPKTWEKATSGHLDQHYSPTYEQDAGEMDQPDDMSQWAEWYTITLTNSESSKEIKRTIDLSLLKTWENDPDNTLSEDPETYAKFQLKRYYYEEFLDLTKNGLTDNDLVTVKLMQGSDTLSELMVPTGAPVYVAGVVKPGENVNLTFSGSGNSVSLSGGSASSTTQQYIVSGSHFTAAENLVVNLAGGDTNSLVGGVKGLRLASFDSGDIQSFQQDTAFNNTPAGSEFTLSDAHGWHKEWVDLPQIVEERTTSGDHVVLKTIVYSYYLVENECNPAKFSAAFQDGLGNSSNPLISTASVAVENRVQTKIVIRKIDEATRSDASQTTITGARFRLLKYTGGTDGSPGSYVGYEDYGAIDGVEVSSEGADRGTLTFSDLPNGEYKIVETGIPDGYLKVDNNDIYFNVTNGVVRRYDKAVDDEGRTEIPAVIAVPDQPEATESNVIAGVSYVPDDDRATATFTVGNTPGAALPNSGGPGTSMISLLGISLICLACAGYVMKRRRKCETA